MTLSATRRQCLQTRPKARKFYLRIQPAMYTHSSLPQAAGSSVFTWTGLRAVSRRELVLFGLLNELPATSEMSHLGVGY